MNTFHHMPDGPCTARCLPTQTFSAALRHTHTSASKTHCMFRPWPLAIVIPTCLDAMCNDLWALTDKSSGLLLTQTEETLKHIHTVLWCVCSACLSDYMTQWQHACLGYAQQYQLQRVLSHDSRACVSSLSCVAVCALLLGELYIILEHGYNSLDRCRRYAMQHEAMCRGDGKSFGVPILTSNPHPPNYWGKNKGCQSSLLQIVSIQR